jgi:hypothetical protein
MGGKKVVNPILVSTKPYFHRLLSNLRPKLPKEEGPSRRQRGHQHLSPAQEDMIIDWIGLLSARRLPPTPGMLKRFVEDLLGHDLGKNWTSRFLKRHQKRVKSTYLPPLDKTRGKRDLWHQCYVIWYQNVSYLWSIRLEAQLIWPSLRRLWRSTASKLTT